MQFIEQSRISCGHTTKHTQCVNFQNISLSYFAITYILVIDSCKNIFIKYTFVVVHEEVERTRWYLERRQCYGAQPIICKHVLLVTVKLSTYLLVLVAHIYNQLSIKVYC